MSKRIWQSSEEHPPSCALLLYVEGELGAREAALVRQHLADCWDCRVRCQNLEKGIHAYVVARRNVLIPHLPPPPPSRHNFVPRLYEEAAKASEPSRFSRLATLLCGSPLAPRRAAWCMGAVYLVMALVTFYLNVANPPTITAAAFFDRVHDADRAAPVAEHYVGIQKVRLTQGNRTVERQVIHCATRSMRDAPQLADVDANWTHSLAAARIDWNDPLNIDGFQQWHDAQIVLRDRVIQTGDRVILTATPNPGKAVILASFTVRASDWHPVAERLEFSDQPPLEVDEISYEIHAEPAKAPRPQTAMSPVSAPKAVPVMPSDADLERSEIDVLEALHRLEADRNEVPQISREDHRLIVRAAVDSAERRELLIAAIGGIAYVIPEIVEISSAPASYAGTQLPTPQIAPSPSYSTTPPLAKALWDYKGGMDVANNYLQAVRESYFRVLGYANALNRLAKRYPRDQWDRLPADVQAGVNVLAEDYIRTVQTDAADYLKWISDPLEEMLREKNIAAPTESADATSTCEVWQGLAPRIVEDLQQTQTSFRRLFVVDHADTPVEVSAVTLLPVLTQLRSRVVQEMKTLCLP